VMATGCGGQEESGGAASFRRVQWPQGAVVRRSRGRWPWGFGGAASSRRVPALARPWRAGEAVAGGVALDGDGNGRPAPRRYPGRHRGSRRGGVTEAAMTNLFEEEAADLPRNGGGGALHRGGGGGSRVEGATAVVRKGGSGWIGAGRKERKFGKGGMRPRGGDP
jgi:hypothetical protein